MTPRGDLAARPSWLRRVAAVVALVAPIAMAVVTAVALAGDVAIAVLAVALVLVANAAIWFALTERGARRAVGAVVAVLAGAGLVVALICCLALGWAGLRREALIVALSLGGAILLSDSVKLLVSRSRPPVAHLQAVTGTSFPSGHATQASAFWFSLVLVLRAARAPPPVTCMAAAFALMLVLGVAASRVYLGVHYPGDVVGGVLLGTGWTTFVVCRLREATVQ